MSPQEGAAEIRKRARALQRELVRAERETLRDAGRVARAMSSGPYSQAQLTKMGHPYATRDPHPPMDPGIINVQSGEFRRRFKSEGPKVAGGDIESRLMNTSREWLFLQGGTKTMIKRALGWLVGAAIHRGRQGRIADAIRRTLAG